VDKKLIKTVDTLRIRRYYMSLTLKKKLATAVALNGLTDIGITFTGLAFTNLWLRYYVQSGVKVEFREFLGFSPDDCSAS
jgi:hypothetical protein